MSTFSDQMAAAQTQTEAEQVRAGAPVAGKLEDEHLNFLKTIKRMVETKEIDLDNPKSFLKEETYEELNEEWLEKTDLALMNISRLLRQINDLYISKNTPDESPQYRTMIEQLWQMKQRIEEHYDVFKF